MSEGQSGYCGLRKNEAGRLTGASSQYGNLSWYHDPLPTNCVGDWVCAGGTGSGYPQFAHCRGPQVGHSNLAVFFLACSFNCLFCQNWHFKQQIQRWPQVPVRQLVDAVDGRTSCICYFGGDPSPQLPFSLAAARIARESKPDGVLRVCWETNGSMSPRLLDRIMETAADSGGCVKFDLKSWDDTLHLALTGATNRRTLSNFRRAGKDIGRRPEPPPLIASTLLVPGYIDEVEVGRIADFIASVQPDIPYSLLAFHPCYHMSDMPLTSRQQAEACLAAARQAGLTRVSIGNQHLLV
jgi:pyruvate formate lyase activating enzyme